MEFNDTRKVIIIGNGFDLAHDLKTRYYDFLVWYLNDSLQKALNNPGLLYKDNLLSLKVDNRRLDVFISELNDLQNFKWLSLNITSKFFKHIYALANKRWVDIEYELFAFIKDNAVAINDNQVTRLKSIEKNIKSLNTEFELLKNKLVEYLKTIRISLPNDSVMNVFKNHVLLHDVTKYDDCKGIIINFNYTKTLSDYRLWLVDSLDNYKIINIHGEVEDQVNNPIIFGYGDEMDPIYAEMERLNNNDLIKNFKSFSYLHTKNYGELMRFLNFNADYEVFVLGHSCGISDRVLLSNVFDRKNCKKITLFYYDMGNNQNDFIEKVQEVSRHFKPESKSEMREKIRPLSESFSLNNCL